MPAVHECLRQHECTNCVGRYSWMATSKPHIHRRNLRLCARLAREGVAPAGGQRHRCRRVGLVQQEEQPEAVSSALVRHDTCGRGQHRLDPAQRPQIADEGSQAIALQDRAQIDDPPRAVTVDRDGRQAATPAAVEGRQHLGR